MISRASQPREAFVWIWLPDRTSPVVAGRIRAQDGRYVFGYGRSYLAREDAIPVYEPELPLRPGPIEPESPLEIANALRDAAPDTWGRRVIAHRVAGGQGGVDEFEDLDELAFMLRSGSDRAGALDFQASPSVYIPREGQNETLERLMEAAERVERGLPLAPGLAEALSHGTSIGGARPKVLIRDGEVKYIAKLSCSTDTYNVVKAEFVAMRLAEIAGLKVAPVRLVKAMNNDVLLVQRFDRKAAEGGWTRRAMVSALTLFGLHELMAAHASYEEFADVVRSRFTAPARTLEELFSRMTFNILVGNTDDHARNHAAFWDGGGLTLTPAYDVCPQSRPGREASQGMRIHRRARRSQLSLCLAAAHKFLLSKERALAIMRRQISTIGENWEKVCGEAALNDAERRLLWRRQFLNELAFEGLKEQLAALIKDLDGGHGPPIEVRQTALATSTGEAKRPSPGAEPAGGAERRRPLGNTSGTRFRSELEP